MRNIFITITRGFIIRNILRSGGLKLLKQKGYKIIIFLQCKEIPDYLQKELGNSQVELIKAHTVIRNLIHRRLINFKFYLIYTKTTKRYFVG